MPNHREYVMWAFKDFLGNYNPERGKLLDVGCGDSLLKNELQEFGFKWTGCDSSSFSNVDKYSMEALGYEDDSFDVVFSCHSFEHCETPIKALREFQRVLKPEGYLFIATPSPCEKQITSGDADHIFVLNPMQMSKLMLYTGWGDGRSYLQKDDIELEQNFNVITIARKVKNEN